MNTTNKQNNLWANSLTTLTLLTPGHRLKASFAIDSPASTFFKKRRYFLNSDHSTHFTLREAQCALLLLTGKTYKTIGECLNIQMRTVESYILKMREKLDCRNKAELIHAIRHSDFLSNFLIRSH